MCVCVCVCVCVCDKGDGSHTNKQFFMAPIWFPTINSVLTHLPGDRVRSNKLRAQSHRTAPTPLQMPITGSRCSDYPQHLSDLATNWRFSQPPFQVQLIC